LSTKITEEEIRKEIWQCDGTKSSEPNDFNFNFIKGSWETLKYDIYQAIQSFEKKGRIPKGCNCSFIALVPKINDLTKLDEYRPISLVRAIYKIISKILANRMKIALPRVIEKYCSG